MSGSRFSHGASGRLSGNRWRLQEPSFWEARADPLWFQPISSFSAKTISQTSGSKSTRTFLSNQDLIYCLSSDASKWLHRALNCCWCLWDAFAYVFFISLLLNAHFYTVYMVVLWLYSVLLPGACNSGQPEDKLWWVIISSQNFWYLSVEFQKTDHREVGEEESWE